MQEKKKERDLRRARPGVVTREKSYLHLPTLLGSLLAGIAGFFCNEWIYTQYRGSWDPAVLITVYFLVLILWMFFAVVAIACIRGELQYHLRIGEGPRIWGLTILGIALIGLAAFGFQYFYQGDLKTLQPKAASAGNGATSYVFVLDDSGSMAQGSDPDAKRLAAVDTLTSQVPADFPYAVYRFNRIVEQIREFLPASEGLGDLSLDPGGSTYLYAAMVQVLEDYDAGIWHDEGNPRVILLTDGQESSVVTNEELLKLVSDYAERGITISTIFLSTTHEPIPDHMVAMAEKTGGSYQTINDADELEDSIAEAAVEEGVTRDLLGRREIMEDDWMYALLRIVFFTLLAVGAKSIMALVNQRGEDVKLILITSVLAGILAGILIEVGINTLMLPDTWMRAATCLLIAFVPATGTREFQELVEESKQKSRLGTAETGRQKMEPQRKARSESSVDQGRAKRIGMSEEAEQERTSHSRLERREKKE